MSARKHNEFLDIPASDDDASDRGYDSEEKVGESKGRNVKRRRTEAKDFFDLQSDDEDNDSVSEGEDEGKGARSAVKAGRGQLSKSTSIDASEDEEEDDEDADNDAPTKSKSSATKAKLVKPLSGRLAKASKKEKRGVVYLSTLPPYLKPFALKNMLEQRGFGPITRTFFTPKIDPSGARKRSNKRQMYTDGWVEFQSKRTAKLAAETMNAQTLGGHGYYADDLLNMKYLRGFKWDVSLCHCATGLGI